MTESTVVEVEVLPIPRSVTVPDSSIDPPVSYSRLRSIFQAIADMVHYHSQMYATAHGERPPVHTVASLFQTVCYENKDQLSAGIIVAGWDEHEGGQVYNVPLGGGIFRQPWSIGGECSEAEWEMVQQIHGGC